MSNVSSIDEGEDDELGKLARQMHQVHVAIPPPDYASNRTDNYISPRRLTDESDAMEEFKAEWRKQAYHTPWPDTSGKSVMIVQLSDFEIYRSPGSSRAEYEFTALHFFDVKAKNLSLNGVLSLGHVQHYVELVDLDNTSVEGYGDEENPMTGVYLQSRRCKKDRDFDIWYKLNVPSKAYARYHEPFLWVADFGKHTIDYLESQQEVPVALNHFRSDFESWVKKRYPGNQQLAVWRKAFGRSDFRIAVNAYIDYLYNQAYNQPDSKETLHHPVWMECLKSSRSIIEEQPQLCEMTVATPLVYNCFEGLYFGKFLEKVELSDEVKKLQDQRKQELGFARSLDPLSATFIDTFSVSAKASAGALKIGDVVGLMRDIDGCWKGSEDWLAYIHDIVPRKTGDNALKVIWLYRPTETAIKDMFYPYKKELFLSDHCNCSDPDLLVSEVTRRYSVDWHPTSLSTNHDIFVRSTWLTTQDAFVTLADSHFHCSHCSCGPHRGRVNARQPNYRCGDSVYILATSNKGAGSEDTAPTLEPAIISTLSEDTSKVTVRRLLRLGRDCSKAAIDSLGFSRKVAENELVWTDELVTLPATRIIRKCHIRFFHIESVLQHQIPIPYSRAGNGDCWILSSEVSGPEGDRFIKYLSKPPTSLNQGFDPDAELSSPPLRGLSIFSGGGNLDRGLEEGGAVRFETAIDISKEAVHTQKANAHTNDLKIYHGSVDDYLEAVLSGRKLPILAGIGDVLFIAAGSPCPGFSALQPDWQSDQSLRNASHITTFCSFVDIYKPKYALLENVVTMANVRKGHEEQNVFGQMVGCLVALGYQLAQFTLDAWSHSSSQRRSRLFLSVTSPGLTPMRQPFLTHSHLQYRSRSLGRLPNGEAFGSREDCPTPFRYVTAQHSTSHLPKIGTGNVQICVPFPDHRLVQTTNKNDRALIKRIPKSPPGQGYVEAIKAGCIPESLKRHKKIPGKSYRRIKAAGHIPTITTTISPQDAFVGEILHWEEDRPISIQEARSAQGIPDNEVIIGSLANQWKTIGNAVDRNVALALGLALRNALETKVDQSPIAAQSLHALDDVLDSTCSRSILDTVDDFETDQIEAPPSATLSMSVSQYIEDVNMTSISVPSTTRSTPLPTSQKRVLEEEEQIRAKSIDIVVGSRKRTRHSGLRVEFRPSSWSKVPEKVLKEANRSRP